MNVSGANMKISKSKLKKLIRETILKEVGPGVGMDPLGATMPKGVDRADYNQLGDASVNIHSVLAVTSVADPTPISDYIDAAIYILEGDTDSAAISLGSSFFGLGAGAAMAKLSKAFKSNKVLKAAENSESLTKEFIEASTKESFEKAAKTEAEAVAEIIESVPSPVSSKVVNMTIKEASRKAGKEITFDNCVKNVKYFGTYDERDIYIVTDALDNIRVFYRSTGLSGSGHKGVFAEIEGFGYSYMGGTHAWFVKTHPNTKTAIAGSFDELISNRLKNLDYESPFPVGKSVEVTSNPQQLAIINRALKREGVDTRDADIHLYGVINGWLDYDSWNTIIDSMPGSILNR